MSVPRASLVESIPMGMEDLRGTSGVQYTEDALVRLTNSAQSTIELTAMYWALLPDPTSEDEKGLTVEITGEDYSLAEIVHHELLEEKSVTFAGVLPPHPLVKKLVLKVRAQRIKPEKAFSNSVEMAIENTHELLESMKKALGGGAA